MQQLSNPPKSDAVLMEESKIRWEAGFSKALPVLQYSQSKSRRSNTSANRKKDYPWLKEGIRVRPWREFEEFVEATLLELKKNECFTDYVIPQTDFVSSSDSFQCADELELQGKWKQGPMNAMRAVIRAFDSQMPEPQYPDLHGWSYVEHEARQALNGKAPDACVTVKAGNTVVFMLEMKTNWMHSLEIMATIHQEVTHKKAQQEARKCLGEFISRILIQS